MRDIRILLADNDPDFLATCAEFLEAAGYQVYKAAGLTEARQALDSGRIHLMIVDLRLTNDDDHKDRSGLTLAKESARSIPKLILTKFPTYQDVREALKLDAEVLPPAVDFVDKRDELAVLLAAIEQALHDHLQMNWNLVVRWSEPFSFPYIVNLIEPEMESVYLPDRAGELEDLVRKLFYDSAQISIGRMFVRDTGRVVLEVFTYGEMREEGQFVVSCGRKQLMALEDERYETFVPKETGIGSVDKVLSAQTQHFAASVYVLVGGDLEEITTFRMCYRDRPVANIAMALDTLSQTTLALWNRRGRFYDESRTASELYLDWLGLREDPVFQRGLEHRIEVLCREMLASGLARIDSSPHQLTLQLSDDDLVSFANPAADPYAKQIPAGAPLLCGITHGRLDADTALVDRRGQTWFVDFAQVDRGPLLCDFVSLETAIRFDLLDMIDLRERYALEQRLLEAAKVDNALSDEGLAPECQRALHVIAHVRQLAADVTGRDLRPYLVGLFLCAMKRIAAYDADQRYTRRELIPYAHALLVAAMLYEKLTGSAQRMIQIPDQARQGLWIDQANQAVWVEGKQIDLTPQEFKILAYLYQRIGQLCTRQAIAAGALGGEYDISEESRFNSALSRLRQKVEPDPDSPKYIITRRGYGYKLDLPL